MQLFIAAEYFFPLYFQSVLGAAPLKSGLLILPTCLSEALSGITVGILLHRFGRYKETIWIGTTLLTIGNGLFIHLNETSSLAEIVILQIIAGIGAGMLFEPPLIAIQAFVKQDDTATATATFGFIRNLATSSSIVIGGVVFKNSMSKQQSQLQAAGLPTEYLRAFSVREAAASVFKVTELSDAHQRMAAKHAFAWSLRNLWVMYTCIGLLAIVASAFIQTRKLSREHRETKTGIKVRASAKGQIPRS